uniref:Uncharacterized protein n=1 Tax=Micrurus lemniscatus lemniscatus TaxID=129467 RepID=A0A2D4HC93_MICLE
MVPGGMSIKNDEYQTNKSDLPCDPLFLSGRTSYLSLFLYQRLPSTGSLPLQLSRFLLQWPSRNSQLSVHSPWPSPSSYCNALNTKLTMNIRTMFLHQNALSTKFDKF